MENFLVACVDLYKELAGPKVVVKCVSTPFIDDLHADSSVPLGDFHWLECPWCIGRFPTDSFAEGRGERIIKKPKTPLIEYMKDNPVGSKDSLEEIIASSGSTGACDDASFGITEAGGFKATASGGRLAIAPMKVVMKLLYAERYARPDLIRACQHLALFFTRWTPECDKQLNRLMCYVQSSLKWRLMGWVGDTAKNINRTSLPMPISLAAQCLRDLPQGYTSACVVRRRVSRWLAYRRDRVASRNLLQKPRW